MVSICTKDGALYTVEAASRGAGFRVFRRGRQAGAFILDADGRLIAAVREPRDDGETTLATIREISGRFALLCASETVRPSRVR